MDRYDIIKIFNNTFKLFDRDDNVNIYLALLFNIFEEFRNLKQYDVDYIFSELGFSKDTIGYVDCCKIVDGRLVNIMFSPKPEVIKYFGKDVLASEMMFYMYLPIKFPEHDFNDMYDNVPERLRFLYPLLDMIKCKDVYQKYVYLTCKYTYVTPDSMSNRKGLHSDGYMTHDVNYIYYDKVPTEFCVQDFKLTLDDKLALQEMNEQAKEHNMVCIPPNNLLRLTQDNIHRVSENTDYEGMRLFVKITCSKHKFNLKGNSHNYLIDYDWKMFDRGTIRNMESNHYSNGDFVKV